MTPEKIQGLIELVGALTLLVTTIGTVVQTIRFGKAKRERDAAYEEAQAEVQGALQDRQHSPEEAKEAAAVRTAGLKERAKTKALAKPKAPLALLLALIGLSGCSLPATIQLPGHPHPVAREKAERVLRPHCGGCQRLAFDLSGYTVQNMVGPYIQQVDQRFGLVGARLDHLEQGVAAVSTFTVDPDIQRVVDALKAQAQAQAREAAKRQGASK